MTNFLRVLLGLRTVRQITDARAVKVFDALKHPTPVRTGITYAEYSARWPLTELAIRN